MNKIPILIILIVLIFTGYYYFKKKNAKPIHYHAGFKIYVDGKLQDFSEEKYMSVKPCSEKESGPPENEQTEKAHLHDRVGKVVHVEAENSRWKDLLQNLNFRLPGNKTVTGYVSGKKINDILDYPIKPYDSVIIFVGVTDAKLLKTPVTLEEIKQAERASESC